ncbi:uncharacterized protein LOC133337221 [Musca vetustissima]|uniref:uncharacterized protein LOC133337221 n=1 Tax=Musca vetustissima TaxID=27455 RepID=UPI002AB7BB00|nr:uncharacterized protein LOC133337221 [Musca vetustissima]
MTTVKFRQLIDMAIGSPEPGHVNFYALHCLLNCIAEKLNILDDPIEYSKYETLILCSTSTKASNQDLKKLYNCSFRAEGGSDPTDLNENDLDNNGSVTDVDKASIDVDKASITKLRQDDDQGNQNVDEIGVQGETTPLEEIVEDPCDDETPKMDNTPRASITSNRTEEERHEKEQVKPDIPHYETSKIEEFENRLAEFENLLDTVAIMRDQLMLATEQQLLLTFLTLSKKPDMQKVHQLLDLTQTLRIAKKENINIKSSQRFDIPDTQSLEWHLSDLQLGDAITEQDILDAQTSCTRAYEPNVTTDHPSQYELEGCLCYSPGKILDQLLQLKGDFCTINNKVNEVTARIVNQERQQTMVLIQELQEQMREAKLDISNLKDQLERSDIRLTNNTLNIENVKRNIDSIIAEKVNKTELDIMLADKVDYNQLQRKVSLDQLLEVQCRIDKRFCEAFKQIKDNDKKLNETAETLRQTLGFASMEGILQTFKQTIESQIWSLRDALQKYVDSTNDEYAAAGARVKVLQDLACLSCDNTCVMRTMEKANVAKLPNAHATQSLSPVITYELGAIRKNGLPQARHAGGPHTTSTAQERVEKVLLSGK